MPMIVSDHQKVKYAASVTMVAQQTKNALLNAVTEVPASGEAQSVADLLDQDDYQRGEEKSRRNPEIPSKGSRRWAVLPLPVEWGKYITKEEKFRQAADPTSNYVRNGVMAVNRGVFDTLLGVSKQADGTFAVTEGGILGIAREGKTPGVGTALPASQYLANSGSGLTLSKLIAAKQMLHLADFGLEDNMDQLFCVISPYQITDLLNLAAESKTNLNAFEIQQIKDGKPTSLLGINWMFTNRLPYKPGTLVRYNPLFSKANIVAARWQGVEGQLWNDTSAKNLPYAYCSAYYDAVRAEDKGVVVIESLEVH